jgi:hypothetical protein
MTPTFFLVGFCGGILFGLMRWDGAPGVIFMLVFSAFELWRKRSAIRNSKAFGLATFPLIFLGIAAAGVVWFCIGDFGARLLHH